MNKNINYDLPDDDGDERLDVADLAANHLEEVTQAETDEDGSMPVSVFSQLEQYATALLNMADLAATMQARLEDKGMDPNFAHHLVLQTWMAWIHRGQI